MTEVIATVWPEATREQVAEAVRGKCVLA